MTLFSIGCDPEFFLKMDSNFVASQRFIEGTKYSPQKLPSGGNVQKDNALIEFAIDPANSKLEYLNNIKNAFSDLKLLLPGNVDLILTPSANLPEKELDNEECKEFGCSQDYNAWTGEVNEGSENASEGTLRSAGGHEHIGFIKDSGNDFLLDDIGRMKTVQILDCVKGFMSVILDNNKEAIERRKLYGKPGCYRPTEYGLEYRTLSNFWLKSPKLVELMYMTTEDCLNIMRDFRFNAIIEGIGLDIVQSVILTGDIKASYIYLNSVIKPNIRDKTWNLFKECEENINNFDYKKEWGI